MNRLEKKCFVTMTAAHALLVVILFVGPGFFISPEKADSFHEITIFSSTDVTMDKTSGGTPQDVKAIPLPPPPTPQVVEQKPVVIPTPPEIPTPPKQVVKDLQPEKPDIKVKPTPHGDEAPPPKTKPKTKLNPDELVSNKPTTDKISAQKKANDEAKARAVAEQKRLAKEAQAFGNALNAIKNNTSGSTLVKMPVGIGGGGAAAINYRDLIASKFYNAWNPAFNLDDKTPDVTVTITIARDGTVTGHITKRSGNSNMDKSVQNALDTVTYIQPFPDSFKEQRMTIPIIFNLEAKRQ